MSFEYKKYPQPEDWRSGCKVSWGTYSSLEVAQEAAEAAYHNGQIDAGRGYDFGYQMPGAIHKLEDGKYEVTFS